MTKTTTANEKEDGRAKANKAQFRPVFDLLAWQKAVHERFANEASERLAQVHKPGQEFKTGDATAKLRAKLVAEESKELHHALLFEDKEQVLKETMDLLFVVFGTIATYDLPLTGPWNAVVENNNLKVENGAVDAGSGKIVKHRLHPKCDLKEFIR